MSQEYPGDRGEIVVNRFKITLKENGVHSLVRGTKTYKEYMRNHDKWLLKDAVMSLHHGIELLLKEMLNQRSEFLIFDNLEQATKKQKEATMSNTGIFMLDEPPRTVSYETALRRVDAFLKSASLDETLYNNLIELNNARNTLEHYAVDTDEEELTGLLAKIHDPIIKFFEQGIGDIEKTVRLPEDMTVDARFKDIVLKTKMRIEDVVSAVRKFNGQRLPGFLLNMEGELLLPNFTNVTSDYRIPGTRYISDVLASSERLEWVIEVKMALRTDTVMYELSYHARRIHATPWLIVFDMVPEWIRKTAKELGVMLTAISEWEELKRLVG